MMMMTIIIIIKDIMGEDGHFGGIWQGISVCIQSGDRNHKII